MPQTPHASTCSSTPSSGHSASGAVPTSMLPGPFQIAARTAPPRLAEPVLAYQLSDNSARCHRSGAPNDRVHLHAHARRRHARRTRATSTPRSLETGVRHVGCKDVGLPTRGAQGADGRHPLQRPRDLDSRSSPRPRRTRSPSARAAAEIRPDHLIGGTLIEPVQEILAGTGVQVLPYVGQIVGHPCLLRGSIDEIVADTKRAGRARRRRHQPARLPLRRRRRGAHARRRRRDRPAGHLRRLGRLRRAHPRARRLRRLGVHDRHGRARRRARGGRAAERAVGGGAGRRRRPGLGGGGACGRFVDRALVDHPADHVELLAVGRLEDERVAEADRPRR